MAEFDIFARTHRPDTALLYRRDDPNDARLGEIARTEPADYAAAPVVLLGCPQDEGVRRNKGRPGAAKAPDEIRRCLYRFSISSLIGSPTFTLFDLGNTIIAPTLEETHKTHREIVRQVIRDGKVLIVLGGGNDTAYPDCSALAMESGNVMAFNIDQHFDVRDDDAPNSGTPYRQLLEEGHIKPENFIEIGSQPFANSPTYVEYLHNTGVSIYALRKLREVGIPTLVRSLLGDSSAKAIFWGFDMDVVGAADAPGVSAPNPVGMHSEELVKLAELAGQEPRTRLVEFTEVNPDYDIDQRTCRLTAAAMFSFLLAWSMREKRS